MLRRTITFPEKELQDIVDGLNEEFDELQHELMVTKMKLMTAVEALDKIQNCNIEVVTAEDGQPVIVYYDAPEACDLAMIMASGALDEIERIGNDDPD